MSISDLSSEEKVKLSEQYTKLNDIVKQREELDTKMIPLYDKLSKLEEEEEKLNKEYNDILSLSNDSLTSEHTLRLSNITSRNVELSNDKEAIKKEMIGLSDNFFNIRKEESSLKEVIENITNKKEGSIFSENDEVVRLDKNGNIVDKINVDSSNFSKIISGGENRINKSNNSITKASNKVVDIIKSNYKSTKPFTYNLSDYLNKKLSKFASYLKSKATPIVQEFKKGYHEEEERVQNIINYYNKIKEEQERVEEEASNLKFISGEGSEEEIQIQYEKNDIDQNLYYPRLEDNEAKENGFNFIEEPNILPVDSNEVNKAKEIDINEVVGAIDINTESNKNVSSVENINIFANIDKFDDELQNNIKMQKFESELQASKPRIIDILKTKKDQFANSRNDKVAKSENQDKKNNMISLFAMGKKAAATIGKVAASISNNNDINTAKKEAIKELDEKNKQEIIEISDKYKAMRDKLEEQKQEQIKKSQNNYNDQIDNIENIFSGKSMVA